MGVNGAGKSTLVKTLSAHYDCEVTNGSITYKNKDLLEQENKVISVDGVNGSEIILGSMTEVSINGNWPSIFDAKKDQ